MQTFLFWWVINCFQKNLRWTLFIFDPIRRNLSNIHWSGIIQSELLFEAQLAELPMLSPLINALARFHLGILPTNHLAKHNKSLYSANKMFNFHVAARYSSRDCKKRWLSKTRWPCANTAHTVVSPIRWLFNVWEFLLRDRLTVKYRGVQLPTTCALKPGELWPLLSLSGAMALLQAGAINSDPGFLTWKGEFGEEPCKFLLPDAYVLLAQGRATGSVRSKWQNHIHRHWDQT